jgi:hypothetical protein
VAVAAKSIVGASSVFVPVFVAAVPVTGFPQEEQKRTLFDSSTPQAAHLAMIFLATIFPRATVYRVFKLTTRTGLTEAGSKT